MIKIDTNLIKKLKNNPCIAEISSFPDAGTTSACIILGSELVEEDKAAAILFSEFNKPNTEYIKKLVDEHKARQLLTIQYKADNTFFIPEIIEHLAPYTQYFIIDDFYSFVLYKNYTFIREFMKRLRSLKTKYNIVICLVNQVRNVIKSKNYNFNTESDIKSLYFEHLEPFVDLRIDVSKDQHNDIYVNLIGEKEEEKASSLAQLLSRIN